MSEFEEMMHRTFLEEARELLESAEAGFMALDDGDHSKETIDKLFRVAHSFKGSAASVGFTQLSKFAHRMEDVLSKVKNGDLVPNTNVCSVFFAALDILRAYVVGLADDTSLVIDSSEVEQQLQECLKQAGQVPSVPQASLDAGFGFFDDDPPDAKPNAPKQPEPKKAVTATPSKASSTEADSIRVATAKVDNLLNIVGELVVNQSMMLEHRLKGTLASDHAQSVNQYMTSIVTELQEISMSLRMLPAKPLFQKMKRAVRDAAVSLNKEIDFVCIGEDIEIDKILLESMTDPLTHLVRNAVDHGIELADERLKNKKSPAARIEMSVTHAEDKVVIKVSDDGKGLNKDVIVSKARSKGIIGQNTQVSDEEAYNLIFAAGFSTRDQVTEISGRGVGLDVVRRAVEDLKGTIKIATTLGSGTTFLITLPLSFSIIKGMIVSVDGRKYIVPVPQLLETLQLDPNKLESSTGEGRMMNIRGEFVPVFSLGEILHGTKSHHNAKLDAHRPGLIISGWNHKVSFEVDEIVGQQEIVLKKLGKEMQGLPGITAAALLSNGEPGLVISLVELAEKRRAHAA